tara:strand:+ start:563 stop:844 length:282 start_codon:yes stop_codon:yes gene_type:complete
MFENGNKYDYSSVSRWATKVKSTKSNVFLLEQLVVPVNVSGSHWCLCVAHVQRKTIQYYDPLGGGGAHCCNGLKAFFKDEVRPRVVPPEVCPA